MEERKYRKIQYGKLVTVDNRQKIEKCDWFTNVRGIIKRTGFERLWIRHAAEKVENNKKKG